MKRSHLVAALALPLLVIVAAILQAELFLGGARDFLFEIHGYDPRDLLRGRYLQFQLAIDEGAEREPCDDATGDCCLCLTRTGPDTPVRTERATCRTARVVCDGALQTDYVGRPLRFYVAESEAGQLERRLIDAMQERRAHALLAVDGAGRAQVRELRVDGAAIAARSAPPDAETPTTVP